MKKFFLFCSVIALCACTHIKSTYYVIDVPFTENMQTELKQGKGPIFAILPIGIPSYLARPQLVLRESNAKIHIAENHRWGESLDKAIGRVLANSLTDKLDSINGVVVPSRLGLHPDYSIQLEISRFEGNINASLEMVAFWTLQKNNKKILQGNFYRKIKTGMGYSELVTAYGTILSLLADDIANAIMQCNLK